MEQSIQFVLRKRQIEHQQNVSFFWKKYFEIWPEFFGVGKEFFNSICSYNVLVIFCRNYATSW